MKVLMLTPWDNAWIPLYRKVFEERGHEMVVAKNPKEMVEADCVLHMWACLTAPVKGAKNIVFMRRFEFFDTDWEKYPWQYVDQVIFCNDFLRHEFDNRTGRGLRTSVVYNAADPDKWTYRERGKGFRIGMACHVHPKKNLPLAAQILLELGEPYELHIAGAVQDDCTAMYLKYLCKRIYMYGHVKDMDEWWDDKDYCLSTSISEGNPNNVIEAMAKGIRPVVHDWPGAEDQFPKECRFKTIIGAVSQIRGDYGNGYRELALKKYSLDNFRRVVDMVEGK